MHHPPFTQGLRPGLLVVVPTSVPEVPHGQVESAFIPFPIPSSPSPSHGHTPATRSPLAALRQRAASRRTSLRRLPETITCKVPLQQRGVLHRQTTAQAPGGRNHD